jgi:hypothetical protein
MLALQSPLNITQHQSSKTTIPASTCCKYKPINPLNSGAQAVACAERQYSYCQLSESIGPSTVNKFTPIRRITWHLSFEQDKAYQRISSLATLATSEASPTTTPITRGARIPIGMCFLTRGPILFSLLLKSMVKLAMHRVESSRNSSSNRVVRENPQSV